MSRVTIPVETELPDAVILELAENGGHVGFVSGNLPWKPVYWHEERILAYLAQRYSD